MEQTWRWFGTGDRITLRNVREAGAEGIVTALHEISAGEVWPVAQIRARLDAIEAAQLRWSVVESVDVSEDVKTRGPPWRDHIDAFRQTLSNLSQCGIRKVAYNLMPVFSWMRTHLRIAAPGGGFALRFDATAFAVFDLCILQRPRAEEDWGEDRSRAAHARFQAMSGTEREALQATILQGLPGGNGSFSLEGLRRSLDFIQLVIELVKLERKRDGPPLPFRADHGQELFNDCEMRTPPGYPAVGRLRGLAELRGAMRMAERLLYESWEEWNSIGERMRLSLAEGPELAWLRPIFFNAAERVLS